jgi:hypothetical protein
MTLARIISIAHRIGTPRAAIIAALVLGLTAESRHPWRRPSPRPHVSPASFTKPTNEEIDDPCSMRSGSRWQVDGGVVRVYTCAGEKGAIELELANGHKDSFETKPIQSTRWIRRDDGSSDFLLLTTEGGRGTGFWTTEQILLCFDRGRIDPILELTESEYTDWNPEDDLERMTIEDTQLHLISNLSFQNWPILRTHTIKQTDYFRYPDAQGKRRHLSHSIITTGEAEYRFDPKAWKYRRVWQRGHVRN